MNELHGNISTLIDSLKAANYAALLKAGNLLKAGSRSHEEHLLAIELDQATKHLNLLKNRAHELNSFGSERLSSLWKDEEERKFETVDQVKHLNEFLEAILVVGFAVEEFLDAKAFAPALGALSLDANELAWAGRERSSAVFDELNAVGANLGKIIKNVFCNAPIECMTKLRHDEGLRQLFGTVQHIVEKLKVAYHSTDEARLVLATGALKWPDKLCKASEKYCTEKDIQSERESEATSKTALEVGRRTTRARVLRAGYTTNSI